MKDFFRKTLAWTLATALTLALAGCGAKKPEPTEAVPSTETSPTATPAPTQDLDSLGMDFLPDNDTDVVQRLLGYPKDTALFTVNGTAVTAEEYLYWLSNMIAYCETMMSYYGGVLNLDEAMDEEGTTWGEELKENAFQNCVQIAITPEAAAQYGVSLDEADLAELKTQRENNITAAGGRESYAYRLQGMGIDDKSLFRIDQVMALFSKLEEVYIQRCETEGTEEFLTDQVIDEYLEQEGILRAKHILLLTKDPNTNEEYDDAKKAEQRAKAEDILAQLRADPTKFDELMNAHSEDTGLATAPDGYVFGPGEMVQPFEAGTRALAVGEISDIVESTFGYHIILRCDAHTDEVKADCGEWRFNETINRRVENAVTELTPEYERLSAKAYYEGLRQYQSTLIEPTMEDMSTATPIPAETDGPAQTPTPAEN